MPDQVLERFWNKVQVDDITECWNWIGAKTQAGYGTFSAEQKKHIAHRFSYQVNLGVIPEGLVLDHLCENRGCVNPQHLKVVTQKENNFRHTSKITHCPKGHPYSGDNLRISVQGKRVCKECDRILHNMRYHTSKP